MLTIGDIQRKIEIQLFDLNKTDSLNLKCIEREASLKNKINRTFRCLLDNIDRPGFEGELNHWQKAKTERNIQNLMVYIEKLCSLLDEEKIKLFCENHDSIIPVQYETDEFILLVNSFYTSVLLDIVWASDISISDLLNITKGKIDHKNLERKLPDKIRQIKKEIIPFLKKQKRYEDYVISIKQSIDSYKHKIYKGASLLVLVAIEGLVRRLGEELIVKQNLDNSYLDSEFNSLDLFLRKIPWKNDIEIEQSELMFLTGDYIFKQERNGESIQLINLKTRLDFLRRTFKKERDIVLHGNMVGLGEIWDLYRNYSALYEVYLTIKYYDEK
ncbi:hypothetical protein [uncultured Draconibacterium sp.]|uniref:hypothetical protein n=1 Tax=uncultured Draconibacterium sp. TaxID=1573823 RepID=UPI00261CEC8B|nr:hypothetical protein [uncultured Draconibacterium sp.]